MSILFPTVLVASPDYIRIDTDDVVIGWTLRELRRPGCIPWSCLPELRPGDVNGGSLGPAG